MMPPGIPGLCRPGQGRGEGPSCWLVGSLLLACPKEGPNASREGCDAPGARDSSTDVFQRNSWPRDRPASGDRGLDSASGPGAVPVDGAGVAASRRRTPELVPDHIDAQRLAGMGGLDRLVGDRACGRDTGEPRDRLADVARN